MSISTVPPISDLAWSTNGYELGDQASITSTGYTSLFSGGGATTLVPISHVVQTPQTTLARYSNNNVLNTIRSVISDVAGTIIMNQNYPIDLGSGHDLQFDPDTQQGQITPALSPFDIIAAKDPNGPITFTGSDIRLIIEVASSVLASSTQRTAYDQLPIASKQIIECTTISISVHREKTPVRALGYINPKSFVRGCRTIAGTMVLTQFSQEVLMRFLQPGVFQNDLSKDSIHLKVDQLPPFNITMLFSDERGYAAYRTLLGVQFVTDGVVYSIQDMLSEQTIAFMCEDFTPLLPLSANSLFKNVQLDNPQTFPQPTPKDKLYKYSNISPDMSNMIGN